MDQIVVVVELTVRPEAREEMWAALERHVEVTRRDRGVVRFEVAVDPEDDARMLSYEIWASQDALDEHAAKPHTRALLTLIERSVVNPSEALQVRKLRPMHQEAPAAYATAEMS